MRPLCRARKLTSFAMFIVRSLMRTVRVLSVVLLLAAVSLAQQTKTPANPTGLALPPDLPSIPAFDISAHGQGGRSLR